MAPNPSRAILIALYTVWYNFCRIHKTLRVTPGMEAGIADHVWTIEELIDAALSAPEPEPAPKTPRWSDRSGGYAFKRNEGLPEGRKPVQLRVIPGGKMTKPKR